MSETRTKKMKSSVCHFLIMKSWNWSWVIETQTMKMKRSIHNFLIIKSWNQSWVIETWTKKMKHSVRHFLSTKSQSIRYMSLGYWDPNRKDKRSVQNFHKLGIIILGYFMGPSLFCKDLSSSCAKAVAMNKLCECDTTFFHKLQ